MFRRFAINPQVSTARLKSVRTKQSLNSIIVAKIAEWVKEDEQTPTPRTQKRTAAKQSATVR